MTSVPDVMMSIWEQLLRYVQKHQPECWRSWFEEIEPLGLENGLLCLGVSDTARQQYLKQSCNIFLLEGLQSITGHLIGIEYALTDAGMAEQATDSVSKADDESDLIYLNPIVRGLI